MTKDEALKMAIEAMEVADAIVWEYSCVPYEKLQSALQACKEALESQEQEPVVIDGLEYPSVVEVMRLEEGDDGNCDVINAYLPQGTKLYTHPVKPLSDDEIKKIWFALEREHNTVISYGMELARAIEAHITSSSDTFSSVSLLNVTNVLITKFRGEK
jgi:hypothetical protein